MMEDTKITIDQLEKGNWIFRPTPNDSDFAGSVESSDGDSICDVYSVRHGNLLAAAPDMHGILSKLREVLAPQLPLMVVEIDKILAKANGEKPEQSEVNNQFLVFGHKNGGKGIIVEVEAEHSSAAIKIARKENPNCRFNNANLK